MTTETPIDDESNATLTDPAPIEGDHPGGPRHDQPPFPAVAAGVDAYLATDSSGHDMHHVCRVFRLTQRFADELNADHDVVGCAALTHDIHRILGDGSGCDPEEKFTSLHKAWNARMESDLYHRRNMNETVNAVIKQKFGTFVRSCVWWKRFRELVIKCVVYNLERSLAISLEECECLQF